MYIFTREKIDRVRNVDIFTTGKFSVASDVVDCTIMEIHHSKMMKHDGSLRSSE